MIRDTKNNDQFNIRCNLVTILLQQKLKKDVPYDILLQQALHEVEWNKVQLSTMLIVTKIYYGRSHVIQG